MLPHEIEVVAAIARKYHVQLDDMTALHDEVVGIMTAGSWTVTKTRGLAPFVVETNDGPTAGRFGDRLTGGVDVFASACSTRLGPAIHWQVLRAIWSS